MMSKKEIWQMTKEEFAPEIPDWAVKNRHLWNDSKKEAYKYVRKALEEEGPGCPGPFP